MGQIPPPYFLFLISAPTSRKRHPNGKIKNLDAGHRKCGLKGEGELPVVSPDLLFRKHPFILLLTPQPKGSLAV